MAIGRPEPIIDEDAFLTLYEEIGPHALAKRLDVSLRGVYARRERIEKRRQIQITSPPHPARTRHNIKHPGRLEHEVKNGVVLIGSDAHYWPGPPSVSHRAFVKFCKDLKPGLVVLNGDVIDAASISRHAPIGWEGRPTVKQEIEAAQDRLTEIVSACGKARKIWTLGNHDSRFETRLAVVAPEYAKVHGIHLQDHFALWEPCWAIWVNDDVVVKHRFKGGIHAPHNNTIWAGKTIITGHLHSAKVVPFTDYDGTRYGVDTGCLADPAHRAFLYTEDNPKNWRSAFCVLTFRDGRLMMPELVLAIDDNCVEFRGEIIKC